MELAPFAVNWDYRCPYARNAHEHLVAALQAGAPWQVTFAPFSLNQVHVEEGQSDVWDDPAHQPALLAMQAALVVRDTRPDDFLGLHLAMFTARHDEGRDIRQPAVVAGVLEEQGIDPGPVLAAIEDGWPLEVFRKEHEGWVADHAAFGVPTFVAGGRAAFVRLVSRPGGDADLAAETIDRVVRAVAGWSELNELKHTSIPR